MCLLLLKLLGYVNSLCLRRSLFDQLALIILITHIARTNQRVLITNMLGDLIIIKDYLAVKHATDKGSGDKGEAEARL